jgi:hypothetical protein
MSMDIPIDNARIKADISLRKEARHLKSMLQRMACTPHGMHMTRFCPLLLLQQLQYPNHLESAWQKLAQLMDDPGPRSHVLALL